MPCSPLEMECIHPESSRAYPNMPKTVFSPSIVILLLARYSGIDPEIP